MGIIEQSVGWKSPSNIAIVKYWGKTGLQLPLNPSVSFTLDTCTTSTKVSYRHRMNGEEVPFAFLFEGAPVPAFEPKLTQFFHYAFERYPELKQYVFEIESSNAFPHSAGIASSASSMSALALCLVQIHHRISGDERWPGADEAGSLARLGSGSACRSVNGGWMMWGDYPYMAYANDDFAVQVNDHIHPMFLNICDTILIVSSHSKSVSSSLGHQMMMAHPYAKGRIDQAVDNTTQLLAALRDGDFDRFARISEEEALSLHALMMSSRPGFILMHPNSQKGIEIIRQFRKSSGIPVCFTLDAGPNIHLLYPADYKKQISEELLPELLELCEQHRFIDDQIGKGPQPILS